MIYVSVKRGIMMMGVSSVRLVTTLARPVLTKGINVQSVELESIEYLSKILIPVLALYLILKINYP